MTRVAIWCVVGLSVASLSACNRTGSDDSPLETNTVVGDEPGAPRLISADGCLTASGDRFVLTELNDDSATAEAYRLVGRDEDLRAHVGKRISVSGESEPEQVVDVRQSTAAPAGAQPEGTAGSTAQVETTESTRIAVHDLRVRTISPSNEPCPGAP
jgi:hypothetical protein